VSFFQHGATADEDENVDVEGDSEMYEEYEWAGQRRIRATTLLVGGFAGEYLYRFLLLSVTSRAVNDS
jgi:hypothetical protein